MKKHPRNERLMVRVTQAELTAWTRTAAKAGVTLSEWVRGRLAVKK